MGEIVYDEHRHGGIRAQFIKQIEVNQGGRKREIIRNASFEKARQERKKLLIKQDKIAKIKYAENILRKEQVKRNENVGFSIRCRVKPNDR